MRPILYSLQFRGHATTDRDGILRFVLTAPGLDVVTAISRRGLRSEIRELAGSEATLRSELVLRDASFEERGEVVIHQHRLRFHTAIGQIDASPDPHLRHGASIARIEGGDGQFSNAQGVITSNFFVSDTGEVTDNQLGVVFVHDERPRAAATDVPTAVGRGE